MNRVDDLAVIDALQVDRSIPEVRVAELPLDHVEWHAFSSHLDSVRVPKLMRREATTDAGSERELAKRFANSRGRPWRPCVGPWTCSVESSRGLLDADSFEDLPGTWQAAILAAEQNRPKLRVVTGAQ